MSDSFQFIRGLLILIMFVLIAGAFAWWRFKESEDRGAMVVRWTVTAVMFWVIYRFCGPKIVSGMQTGDATAVFGLLGSVVVGLILAIIWVPEFVGSVGNMFGSLYTGGSRPDDPKPFYSIAQAQRTQGHYSVALMEVRKQLARFPTDFEGQMLMASIQAENLDDLPGAAVTIERFREQDGHAPMNIAYGQNLLADWYLKIAKDREAARGALEKIIELLPDTEFANQAAQRIGRLADTAHLLEPDDRRVFKVQQGADNIGLMQDSSILLAEEVDPQTIATEYVKHLQAHPLDGHIREKLAILYANHYHRLDLAADQFEQLIMLPNQPRKQIAHWLNLLADLQIKNGAPIETARATLQRIVDNYPDMAMTQNTRRRMDLLKLEYKALEESETVHMGEYEQNIGLKPRRRPEDMDSSVE